MYTNFNSIKSIIPPNPIDRYNWIINGNTTITHIHSHKIYTILNPSTGKIYIGKSNTDMSIYRGSQRNLKELYSIDNFDPLTTIPIILFEFTNSKDAYNAEALVLDRIFFDYLHSLNLLYNRDTGGRIRENNKERIRKKTHHLLLNNPVHAAIKAGTHNFLINRPDPNIKTLKDGTHNLLGENNPNAKNPPWLNSSCTRNSKHMWLNADLYYSLFNNGYTKSQIANVINSCELTRNCHRRLCNKIFNGWIPSEDNEWVSFCLQNPCTIQYNNLIIRILSEN